MILLLWCLLFMKKLKRVDTNSAIITGAQERLRAVMLTSLTTIAGLTPLLFEGVYKLNFETDGYNYSIWTTFQHY